tara:strand:+ start:360 stop:470 length:111 start_codon:yes stop_codon:yes gene_type:complete
MYPKASDLDGGILIDYLQYFEEFKKTDEPNEQHYCC